MTSGPEEEIPSAETHKETIEIQHTMPEVQEIPETTRVTKTIQVQGRPEDTVIVPEETIRAEAVRIDQKLVIETSEKPRKPGPAFEIRVGVPKTVPSTTGEKLTETTTFTTITSQIQVSPFSYSIGNISKQILLTYTLHLMWLHCLFQFQMNCV